jgi:hypothetical protein
MTANAGDEFQQDETPGPTPKPEFVENETPPRGREAAPPLSFSTIPPEWWREIARASLAVGLMLLLGLVLVIVLNKPAGDAKDLLGQVLAPLIALLGAATGFYYGEKK